jgi:hypothetical protein
MSDDSTPVRLDIARLARDVAEHFADLLRLHRIRTGDSRVYKDARFSSWLAREARAVVEMGLEKDPWTREEVESLAERIRAAVLAEHSGVRQVRGRPVCVPAPEMEREATGVLAVPVRGPAPWVQLATAAGIGREIWDEDCDSWVDVPDDLAPAKYVAINVRGDSMQPLLHDGDTVLVAMGVEPVTGNIVLARTDDGYVVKRLERITTRGVYLQSLNAQYDVIVVRDIPRPIVGSVVLRWCPHGEGT